VIETAYLIFSRYPL